MAFSISPTALFTTAQLASGNTTVYTSPTSANTYVTVQKVVVSNTSGAAVNFTLYRAATGGSATTGTTLVPATSIAAGTTLIVNEANNMVLNQGDLLIANAGAASSLNLTMSGIVTVTA